MARPARVRFYIDADLLGLARVLAPLRADVTYPGDSGAIINGRERAACVVAEVSAKDVEWIPLVAAQEWLIVTRDRHIQQRPGEITAVRDHHAKMINLSSDDARNRWGQLEVFMTRWREIDTLADQPGPYIYNLTRTGALRPIALA